MTLIRTLNSILKGEYCSKSRNGTLARIFKECKIYDIKKLKFCEIANGFKVTLFDTKRNEGVNEGAKLTRDVIA